MTMQQRLAAIAIVFLASAGEACTDPTHDREVDALGPEKRGVRPGPNHRPGQNCLTCHGGEGPGSPEFVVAGTIYLARGVLEPVPNVEIELRDADGKGPGNEQSNEVGNFYIGKDEWSPKYPITVKLKSPAAEQKGEKAMLGTIGRTAACALCHFGAEGGTDHQPAVFLREKEL